MSNNSNATFEAAKMAVLYYGAGFLPKLRQLTREQVQAVAQEAGDENNKCPLWLHNKPQFALPSWDAKKKLTGCEVIALMVFSIWVLCGESFELAGPIVAAWPIREALALAPKPAPQA